MAAVSPGQCTACGNANSPGSLFCAGCGTQLACPACQAPLAADAAFCTNCGKSTARRPDTSRHDLAPGRPIERRVEQTTHLRIFVQTGSFADQQSSAVAQRLESLIAAA